jgi:hypothetical protein
MKKKLIINKKLPEKFALNTKAAADYLGCSEALLRKLRGLGNGPKYSKLGKKVVYPIPELKRFLKDNLVK